MVQRYTATVSREDGFWVAVVNGVPGGATEARRLPMLHAEVLDLLSGLLEVDEEDLEVDYDYTKALGQAASRLDRYRVSHDELNQARRDYEAAQVVVVRDLRAADVSLRDAAELLGISFQRVQQLAAAERTMPT